MQHPSPYASADESAAVIHPDLRSPAEKKLDQLLEERFANEQGVSAEGYIAILLKIAVELLEAAGHK